MAPEENACGILKVRRRDASTVGVKGAGIFVPVTDVSGRNRIRTTEHAGKTDHKGLVLEGRAAARSPAIKKYGFGSVLGA